MQIVTSLKNAGNLTNAAANSKTAFRRGFAAVLALLPRAVKMASFP